MPDLHREPSEGRQCGEIVVCGDDQGFPGHVGAPGRLGSPEGRRGRRARVTAAILDFCRENRPGGPPAALSSAGNIGAHSQGEPIDDSG